MSTINVSNLAGPSNTGTAAILSSLNGGSIAGSRNRIINGAMTIDQRNGYLGLQTFTAGAALAYSADRWYGYCTGANVVGGQMQELETFRYRFTGAAGVTSIGFGQRIEDFNSQDLAGTTATLSVNMSNTLLTTATWTAYYANTTNTFGTLASPTRTQIATGTFTITSTSTTYSAQISIPLNISTGIEIVFTVGAQTSGIWRIANVQLERGTVATPFEHRSYGQELALCQRYYFRLVNNTGSSANILSTFQAISAGSAQGKLLDLPVPMRTTPTAAASISTWTPRLPAGTNGNAFTTYVIDQPTRFNLSTSGWTGSSGLTAGYATGINFANTNYIEASAEL
jgi:hypothetical protein